MKKANDQKTVLITGVTRGLGLAMAEEFARIGHVVLGCGRSQNEIQTLRKRLEAPHDFEVVDVASDGEAGLDKAILRSYAAIILDVLFAGDWQNREHFWRLEDRTTGRRFLPASRAGIM